MAKRRKKSEEEDFPEVEENQEDLVEDYRPRTYKRHEWSDDGARYNVMKELPDSVPGTRHYGTFFETKDLATAKHECFAHFQDYNVTTLIVDRAERNSEIVRHEAEKEVKHDKIQVENSVKETKKIKKPITTVKRK